MTRRLMIGAPRSDAFAGLEAQARARRRKAHGRHDELAVGDVRVVDRNRIGKGAGQKRFEGRARRAAGAGAGRLAAPEGRSLRLGHARG
jgi:hypothetical protein